MSSAPPPIQESLSDLPDRFFALVGPKGAELLPGLIGFLQALSAADRAERGHLWPSSIKALTAAVGRFGPRAETAVDALVALLETGYPEQIILSALERIGPGALNALPAIVEHCRPFRVDLFRAALTERSPVTENVRAGPMHDAQFVLRLGAFGDRARALGPDLERIVDKPLPLHAQYAVATAILEIGYESTPAVHTLFTGLTQREHGSRALLRASRPLSRYDADWARAIRALTSAGANLEPIRPDLETLAHSEHRVLPNSAADTGLQDAALEALR